MAACTEPAGGEHELDSRLSLIQQLIPIGLMAVEEALQEEVIRLVENAPVEQGL